MAGKRILVTGAAGFIGSHLSNRLAEHNNVRGFDDYSNRCDAEINFECIKGDVVTDTQLMDEMINWADIVYHLAAQGSVPKSWKDGNRTYAVNVDGTRNVLKACEKHGKMMVLASTCEVYGTGKSGSIPEDEYLNPESPYAISKAEAEKLCIEAAENRKARVLILRSFNTYGPFQHEAAVIPNFVKNIATGKSPRISGEGNQKRDFMYIRDALEAFLKMTDLGPERGLYGEPINFGTGMATSMNELAKMIAGLLDSDFNPEYIDARRNEVDFEADITRAGELGFTPKIGLGTGLRAYIEWFKPWSNATFQSL